MEELEILVQHSHRQVFDEILKNSNIPIVKEENVSTNIGAWLTVQLSSLHETYLLGKSFGHAVAKLNNSNREWSDLELEQEFHSFLQGERKIECNMEKIKEYSCSVELTTIEAAIKEGIDKVRETVEPLGATIPKATMSVVIRDTNGNPKAIKLIQI